jgi:hypothetical protein
LVRRRVLVALFLSALLLRLAIAAESGMFHALARSEMEGIALNVAGFGDYSLYGVPSAYDTPVFPLFLAGIFGLFGTGLLSKAVCVVLGCAVSSLRAVLVPVFALDAGFERPVALLAGWVSVFYIGSLETEVSGNVEGPYVAVVLLALLWASLRIWRAGSWRTRTPWWFFAFCGFSVLLSPTLLPVLGGLLLAGAIACPREVRRRYFRQAGLAALGVAVFLLPWAIRNQVMLGAPILTRSNFGTEFWVSNGPGRTFDHPHNYHLFHPTQNPLEAARVADLGEVEYNRRKLAEAAAWVRAHPGEFLRLAGERIAAWWFPPHPYFALLPKLVLTLLAFAGLRRMFRRQALLAWLILIAWLTFPDVYYLVHWSSRYRVPMEWQILFCACVALFGIYQAAVRWRRHASNVESVA